MTQPEESQEKTAKVDDILLKPVLKDLEKLREGEELDDDVPHRRHEQQSRSADEDS